MLWPAIYNFNNSLPTNTKQENKTQLHYINTVKNMTVVQSPRCSLMASTRSCFFPTAFLPTDLRYSFNTGTVSFFNYSIKAVVSPLEFPKQEVLTSE